MDELERALRAVLDDPAQLQELRELLRGKRMFHPATPSVLK